MVGNSDEYAETVVSLQAPERSLGIGARDQNHIYLVDNKGDDQYGQCPT